MDGINIDTIKQYRGQVTKNEVEHLAKLAKSLPENALIVEIGAYRGKSGGSIAFGMPKSARLMSIDPWVLQNETPQEYETMATVQEYHDNLLFAKPRVVQVIAYPNEVADYIGEIDMLFIDAIKNGVTPIWEKWLPKVKKGGIIASHDYLPDPNNEQFYPEVVQVIETMVKPITTNHEHVDFTFSGIKK